MGPVAAEVEIDVPRPRTFEFVGDLANRPAFMDHFVSDLHLERIESSGLGAGARFRLVAPLRAIWMETTIVEMDEPHRIVEHGRGGRNNRIPSTTVWELIEGPGRLTIVRVSYWTEPSHPLDRAKEIVGAASIWCERDWRVALRRLRDLLESGASAVPRVGVAGGNRYATGIP